MRINRHIFYAFLTALFLLPLGRTFAYTGHQLDSASGGASFSLDYDKNGNMTDGVAANRLYRYNWDNKLYFADIGAGTSLRFRYDPAGNCIYRKKDSIPPLTYERKYIVDIVGDLPVKLLEIDPDDTWDPIKKTYYWGNGRLLAQQDGDSSAARYFYLHDRLGSVRLQNRG